MMVGVPTSNDNKPEKSGGNKERGGRERIWARGTSQKQLFASSKHLGK